MMLAKEIVLTISGSTGMQVHVDPSPFDEAPDGRVLWLDYHGRREAITFTRSEAAWLASQLGDVA